MKSITLNEDKIVLNVGQSKFINAFFDRHMNLKPDSPRECAFFGAVRCGKSYIYQLFVYLVCMLYPNTRVLYIRDTYDQLKDTVIKQFNDDFSKYGGYTYKKADREAVFQNGSVIKFRAFDIDGRAVLSSEYEIIALCQAEDIPEDVFLMSLTRMSGLAIPHPIMLTEGNPANTWSQSRYKDATQEQLSHLNILFIEAGTNENESNLPKDYIEELRKNYPTVWFNRYVLGGWDQIDEMVFSEFRERIHIKDPFVIPKSWQSIIGFDYGFKNPASLIWLALDYDGNLVIYDEWYEAEKLIPDISMASMRHGQKLVIADYSIKSPGRDGRSIWTELLDHGMKLLESNKDKLANITLVNQLLKQQRLTITSNCVNLIREIKGYKWKRLKLGSDKNMPEEVVKKDDHAIDALMYGIAYLFGGKSEDPSKSHLFKSLQSYTERIDFKKSYDNLG